ncbi:MAG TPA: dihydroorotate dehydrogenase [Acidimicrobiia bacterium]
MAPTGLRTTLGPLDLSSPLVAASGTVGSVWEWADVADTSFYGAAVAKSVSGVAWPGRPAPRLAPLATGMLNGIGIQNPGIDAWMTDMKSRIGALEVPIWGSAVGETVGEFVQVAAGLERSGVSAIEVNLSCPNLEGTLFALDPSLSAEVIAEVSRALTVPVGAKLSPNSEEIVPVAAAVVDAGASFVTLTNTAWGFGIDVESATPKLSGGVGGYSGPGLKAIAMRCVYQVAKAIPGLPILGCGGVSSGHDVVEYIMAGASAVGLGTVHFAEPKAGKRIFRETERLMKKIGANSISDIIGVAAR